MVTQGKAESRHNEHYPATESEYRTTERNHRCGLKVPKKNRIPQLLLIEQEPNKGRNQRFETDQLRRKKSNVRETNSRR
jgi:hypothetical protein